MTLREHPISFLRKALDERGVTSAHGLFAYLHGRAVTVAGLVLLRQRPGTAKGVTFVTLEDETGVVNLIIRQDVWEAHRRAARFAVVMLASGQLQREGAVIHTSWWSALKTGPNALRPSSTCARATFADRMLLRRRT